MYRCIATALVAAIASVSAPADPAAGQPASAGPVLAGTLPRVETAIVRGLDAAQLTGRVVRIAADTNGRLIVASVGFTFSAAVPDPLPEIQTHAWNLTKAAFAAVQDLSEIHLSAYHEIGSSFDTNRADVTFSMAVSRSELLRMPVGADARVVFLTLPRVSVSPALTHASLPARHAALHEGSLRRGPIPLEGPPSFWGPTDESVRELEHRRTGKKTGAVVASKLYRGDPRRPMLALTFDDGPVPVYTTLLLDTLGQLRIRATFFLIGRRVEQYPYFAMAIVAGGHELGNHTFHHVNLVRVDRDRVAKEIADAQAAITAATGVTPRFFRPPGGDYDSAVVDVARSLGLVTVFWTDDPADYARPGIGALERRLLQRVSNGGILLLHQGVEETIRVLPITTGILDRRGYALTTVSGLLGHSAQTTR